MKKGFTLVELSIVLVIIGLLIGGILAAQSMVTTTKIQRFIREMQQLDVAVRNFQTKFKTIPGDSKSFGGNGDGFIDYSCTDTLVNQSARELETFSTSLMQTGFKPVRTVQIIEDVGTFTVFVFSYSKAAKIFPLSSVGGCAKGPWSGINNYLISNAGVSSNDQIANSVYSVFLNVDLIAIDTKMDDGNVSGGNIQGEGDSSCDDLTITTPNCQLWLKFDR